MGLITAEEISFDWDTIRARLTEIENERLSSLEPAGTPVRIDEDLTLFLIYFDSRSLAVRGQQDVLERAVKAIRAHPGCRVVVNGHTDRHGHRDANNHLGAVRALAVGSELMARGIPGSTMEFQSFGATALRDHIHPGSEDADRMNRRVEIVIAPPNPS